jgi:hypothetical protein
MVRVVGAMVFWLGRQAPSGRLYSAGGVEVEFDAEEVGPEEEGRALEGVAEAEHADSFGADLGVALAEGVEVGPVLFGAALDDVEPCPGGRAVGAAVGVHGGSLRQGLVQQSQAWLPTIFNDDVVLGTVANVGVETQVVTTDPSRL